MSSAHVLLDESCRLPIERAASDHLGRPWRVSGFRDLNELASHPCGVLSDGVEVFAKLSTAPDAAQQFGAELDGLRCLSDLGGAVTPVPVGRGLVPVGTGVVLLFEAVRPLERTASRWREIGRTLGRIHRTSAARFGFDRDCWFGPLPQDNRPVPAADWSTYYAERRLGPMLAAATASGRLPASVAGRVERLIDRLPGLCGPDAAPALLHGDAQQNNFISTAGGAVVIDPAVYFGHPEVDLALVDYFEKVPDDVFDGYREEMAISPGFAERRSLWRVFAYLAAVTVEGGPYLRDLTAALDEYVA